MRIEELGRSVVFLTRENQELREQNEIFRQMVVSYNYIVCWVSFCTYDSTDACSERGTRA